ncbi:hypothetical protein [Candidatus Parabeggiatoa sp. HSG14]|uniref:hypothetical protein n=1 Tax=Candidatus Parabeggiatoa sp. HSG14 TaxID=3055593 RepID=UPI0025A6E448|nr:hypothetical protein [Thiotrichales bacterium HSG14]
MNKIIRIYCEGKAGSHDYDILRKVFPDPTEWSAYIEIEPIGSIRGAGAIIQYKEEKENNADKPHFKLLFRDRDFDKPVPDRPILEQDEDRKYCYYSYRNTIENYLFDTSHFYSFLKENKLNEKYSINNENEVKQKFIEAAEKIKYYQAVRHTMGKMRTGETEFGTKLTNKSGKLPEHLDENYCKQEALKKINQAKSFTDSWTETGFNEIYLNFVNKFDANFMNNLDFLIYFQGKDFASSLQLLLQGFPIKKYYKYAKKHFDYNKFSDLIELRNLIESKLTH